MTSDDGQNGSSMSASLISRRLGLDHETPMKEVAGKVAFITGGDSGIGLGIARALLNANMKIVITYRTDSHLDQARELLRQAQGQYHAIHLDVTDRAAMAAAAEETIRLFGKVHVLVNNAGVAPLLPLSSTTFDDWDWCMSVNLDGVFNGIATFLPLIKTHGEGGQIVATSSMLGGLVAGPLWAVYSASKFAVVGMMEALRAELSHTGIGVSIFCPAGVRTNLGLSTRNRPSYFARTGTPNAVALREIEKFGSDMQLILENCADALMDPAEAGERVLEGIRNNDLYILSHPEYEQALRERHEALLASLPNRKTPLSKGRIEVSRLGRNPIYAHERNRKLGSQVGST